MCWTLRGERDAGTLSDEVRRERDAGTWVMRWSVKADAYTISMRGPKSTTM